MDHIKHIRHGWINIYRGHINTPHRVNGFIHPTEHAAREVAQLHGDDCIATVRIEWEE